MRVALALGAGGARGYAHIGVIDELRARGHTVVAISGTSMGAVVGGLEAGGALEGFTEWVTALQQRDVFRLLDPTFTGPGAIRGQRLIDKVADRLGGVRIEDFPIPFTAVATDLTMQREVWFQRGPVETAMRASIAVPSAFTPVMINGRLLADGGLVNPVPMEPLLDTPADFTVAVDASGRRSRAGTAQPVAESADVAAGPDWMDRFRRNAGGVLDSEMVRAVVVRVAQLRGRGNPGDDLQLLPGDPVPQDLPRDLRLTDVVSQAMEVSAGLIARFRMAANPPDALVTIPVDAAGVFDFHRATELIELGRRLAVESLDRAGL